MQRSVLCRSRRELSNAYFLAKFGFDTAENVSHPTPTQHGVVSYVCPHSRIAAVSLAEFVAVHIVLVKLPVAILTHQPFRVKYYYSQSSFRTPPVPSVFEDSPVYRRRYNPLGSKNTFSSFLRVFSEARHLPFPSVFGC